jgi:hypothetical protein
VIRFALTLSFFAVLSLAVGILMSGEEFCDWGVAGGLFALAVAGESLRLWLQRSRAKKQQSSGI